MEYKEPHRAIYGNIQIQRIFCEKCNSYSLVLDGKTVCCDSPVLENEFKGMLRISQPERKRKNIPEKIKKQILALQKNKCKYCGEDLDSYYHKDNGVYKTKTHFDHIVPFAYSFNNKEENIVAVCNICNSHKSDKVFKDFQEMIEYLEVKRMQKGIWFIG